MKYIHVFHPVGSWSCSNSFLTNLSCRVKNKPKKSRPANSLTLRSLSCQALWNSSLRVSHNHRFTLKSLRCSLLFQGILVPIERVRVGMNDLPSKQPDSHKLIHTNWQGCQFERWLSGSEWARYVKSIMRVRAGCEGAAFSFGSLRFGTSYASSFAQPSVVQKCSRHFWLWAC